MNRDRFSTIWNGSALIIFFAGIFLGFNGVAGIGATTLAIFMWIIGGTVQDMIFGKKSKEAEKMMNQPGPLNQSIICKSCGETNSRTSEFCIECGASMKRNPSATSLK